MDDDCFRNLYKIIEYFVNSYNCTFGGRNQWNNYFTKQKKNSIIAVVNKYHIHCGVARYFGYNGHI